MSEQQSPSEKSESGLPMPVLGMDDAQSLAQNMFRLFEESGKVFAELADRSKDMSGPYSAMSEAGEASKVLGSVAQYWVSDPVKLVNAQTKLAQGFFDIWGNSVRQLFGQEVEPVAEPEPGDARFKDSEWTESQYYDFWKQVYLLTSHWVDDLVRQTEGLDEKTKMKAEFYINQVTSALSPTNFVFTNPEVVRETIASKGENLVNGMQHFVEDLRSSSDLLHIKQTDPEAFEVGVNLAITPGKVVFRNELFELIQYTPTTEQVHEIPLLIVPPWINKFYILDLTPEKSFIKWAVEQGFTVFTMSWVNPDTKLAGKTFEDYMTEGVFEAVSRAIEATGAPKVNTLGYCVGGTLLSVAMAHMADTGDERIGTATFFTMQVDFTRGGELLVFIDDTQLKALEEMMAEQGYLDGSRMATVFNMLRPRDLIWPYVVNNYLLGKKPFPFDLLYWNSDSTRMPAANHNFYMREFYRHNTFSKGELELAGVKLDIGKIKVPIYELAAIEDHIAPADSVYHGALMFGGPIRFVLAGSGHIAGVINPPYKTKYQHWVHKQSKTANFMPKSLEAWHEKSEEIEGSWWPDWAKWLADHSGEMVDARTPGDGPLEVIQDAPGSYVLMRGLE